MPRRFATQQAAAQRYHVIPRTIRNWISRGLITGYKLPGGGAIRVDLDEIDKMIKAIPAVQQRVLRTPYGPNARIVHLTDPEDVPSSAVLRQRQAAAEAVGIEAEVQTAEVSR